MLTGSIHKHDDAQPTNYDVKNVRGGLAQGRPDPCGPPALQGLQERLLLIPLPGDQENVVTFNVRDCPLFVELNA